MSTGDEGGHGPTELKGGRLLAAPDDLKMGARMRLA